MRNLSVADLQKRLRPALEQEHLDDNVIGSILDAIKKAGIDGEVFLEMTGEDFKENFPELIFGHRKKLIIIRDHFLKDQCPYKLQENTDTEVKKTKPFLQRTEYVREFGQEPTTFDNYQKGKYLNKHEERAGNLISPVRQFFPCTSESTTDICEFIADRVTEFAAACLNDRTNGTIYFGIGDAGCAHFGYGEVLGIVVDKKDCEDAVRLSTTRRFCPELRETALHCIKPPIIIDVRDTDHVSDDHLVVCEVDVEPTSDWVKDHAFFITSLSSSATVTSENTSEHDLLLYRLSAGIPTKQDSKQIEQFSGEKLQMTEDRRRQEKSLSSACRENLIETLQDYMCGGGDKLEGNFYRILATPSMNVSHPDFSQNIQFIFNMDWRCILDFDPVSDKDGLYSYAEKEKEQVYNKKTTKNVIQSSDDPQEERTCEQFQDLMESPHKQWILCNGCTSEKEEGLPVIEWKQRRSEGYREVVRLLKKSIPKGRGVILILVTSHDDVFIEASEELLLKFKNQWLMIAESKRFADAWVEGLKKRNMTIDENRCIYKFSFFEINKAVTQLLGSPVLTDGQCVVATASGVQTELGNKVKQELCDLDVVSAEQCKEAESLSVNKVCDLSLKTEENFYKGNSATWWNFYFQGHVCRRERYERLLAYTREELKNEYAVDHQNFRNVEIYHHPGAGGTTVAMNVLWDLKSAYKCCRVKRITKETARQIFQLYELGESQRVYRSPVLVMLDNEDEEKVGSLKKFIDEECDRRGLNRVVCVFLSCLRRMNLSEDHERTNVVLSQKLSQRELQFFLDKYETLKQKFTDSKGGTNPDSLLGLNIMKENFNEDYIKRTVKMLLEEFQEGKEKTVLKYVALLNHYDLSFQGIPLSCFDPLMVHDSPKVWDVHMPAYPLLTFTYNMHLSGRTKCLRISCHLLCKYILDISLDNGQSHGDLMEEFLWGPIIQRSKRDVAYRELLRIVNEIMKKRCWADDKTRSKFSPFIQSLIVEDKYESAAKCMELVFEHTDDPMLAQQMARFFSSCNNWDNAVKWADKAIEKLPQNCYLLDTKGQISKSRLSELLKECERNRGSANPEILQEAVSYAQQGLSDFSDEQRVCCKETFAAPNMAGYFGQMDIIMLLVKILKCCCVFQSASALQRFFSDREFIPENLKIIREHVLWLKSIQEHAIQALRSAEDGVELYSGNEYGHSAHSIFLSEGNLDRYRNLLRNLFDEDDLLQMDVRKMNPGQRRRVVCKLGGYSLFSILKIYRERNGRKNVFFINKLMTLNLERSNWNRFDLSMALASAICLCSDIGDPSEQKPYLSYVLKWSAELCRMKEQQEYIDLDPFVYFLVFYWPSPSRTLLDCHPQKLYRMMKQADDAFKKKLQQVPGCRKRNLPLFFLTKHPADNSIVSREKLAAWAGTDFRGVHRVNRLLKSPQALNLLERFSGVVDNTGWNVKVTLEDRQGKKMDLNIPVFTKENKQRMMVSFVLGFGPGGPIACDIDSSPPHPCDNQQDHYTTHPFGPRQFYPESPRSVEAYDIDKIMQEIWEVRAIIASRSSLTSEEASLITMLVIASCV